MSSPTRHRIVFNAFRALQLIRTKCLVAHKCGDPIAKLQFYGCIRYSITTIVTFISVSMRSFFSFRSGSFSVPVYERVSATVQVYVHCFFFIAAVSHSLVVAKSLHKSYNANICAFAVVSFSTVFPWLVVLFVFWSHLEWAVTGSKCVPRMPLALAQTGRAPKEEKFDVP